MVHLIALIKLSSNFVTSRVKINQWNRIIRSLASKVDIRVVPLPSLSPTMTQGSIAAWKKQPGDLLIPGDVMCEIETDKASVGLEIQDEGVLAKILVPAQGLELDVGKPIALVVDSMEGFNEFKRLDPSAYQDLIGNPTKSTPKPVETISNIPKESIHPPIPSSNLASTTDSIDHSSTSSSAKPKQLSPAARHLVESKLLDVSNIKGSGKGGKIVTKGDVIHGLASGAIKSLPISTHSASLAVATISTSSTVNSVTEQTSSAINANVGSTSISVAIPTISTEPVNSRYKEIPNSNIRKVIAKRLTESKATVPHLYVSIDVNIDKVLSFRKELKKTLDLNVSVNDVVIKSVAMALRDVPEAYAKWNKLTSSISMGTGIDISVAVATPTGLITPILTNADKRGLAEINAKVKDLATRARDGKLKPEEFQGGAFSVSNLGMFGINSFSAVLNPPQACILAVGSGVSHVVPPSSPPSSDGKKGKPKVVTTVTVQLSADRRVIDEAVAGQFLQVFRDYLSDPMRLVL